MSPGCSFVKEVLSIWMSGLLIHRCGGPPPDTVPIVCPEEGRDGDVGSPLQAGQVESDFPLPLWAV